MKVALYVRVSTKEQVEGYSIGEQKDRLEAYAKAKDYTVVKTYVDGGHSGGSLDRPAMQEMIKNIKNYQAVIVYNLKRLSRSQKDTLYMVEDVFLVNGVEFISLSESLDTSTPYGRAMIGVLSAFAQLDREQIKEQMTLGRVARAKDGYYHGGDSRNAPIGYDYINGELVVNEYEAECVRYIFDEYLKGKGYYKIYEDIQKKFTNVIENDSTISKVLKRHLYYGKVEFKGELYKGRHIPLITEETFNNAQNLMNKRAARNKHSGITYLLTGLLYCGCCGARLAGHAGKKLKSGNQLRYYTCYSRRGTPKRMVKDKNCKKKFERKEVLEDKVIEQVSKLTLADVDTVKKEDDRIGKLQKEKERINNQLSKLVELYSIENTPIEIIKKQIDDLTIRKDNIKKRIDELSDDKVDVTEIKNIIAALKGFKGWDDEKKQVTIMKLVERIIVHNDNIVIHWVF